MPTLRETRIRRLLSLRDFAKRADVSLRTLVEAEAGRSTPYPRTMRKISDSLGVDVMEIDEFRAAVEAAIEKKAAA